MDIVKSHIAPFLHARPLDCLRTTCRAFQFGLASVVPGMKLKLFSHQVTSLSWMRQRETLELTEFSCQERFTGNACYGGDAHRAITGGTTVQLIPRRKQKTSNNKANRRTTKDSSVPFAHYPTRLDQRFGRTSGLEEQDGVESTLARKIARGGMLCDDPGLGKTITVLSLILQTMGLSSHSKKDEYEDDTVVCNDHLIFDAYWREQVPEPYQKPDLLKLLGKLERSNPNSHIFYYPVDPEADGCVDYYDVIKDPMEFQTIQRRIESGRYSKSFERFYRDVRLVFNNALSYHKEGSPVAELAAELRERFETIVSLFRDSNVQIAKRYFSNAEAKPDSSVAALIERQARRQLLNSIIRSSATLLVVPGTLLQHWEEQINLHIDTRYFTDKEAIVFKFTGKNDTCTERIEEICEECQDGVAFPFLFIDDSPSTPLPDENFLAMFSIVLTTSQRFSNEWRLGSFAAELRSNDKTGSPYVSYTSRQERESISSRTNGSSPFLKIHWARMVVDEGHHMGRGKTNNSILFAAWVSAERRWAMTGTPTPQTVARSGLQNLLGLMGFLQHEFFTPRQNGDQAWSAISRCWNNGLLSSFFRVRSLIEVLMVRHTKLDIEELPRPQFETKMIKLSSPEVRVYGTLFIFAKPIRWETFFLVVCCACCSTQ